MSIATLVFEDQHLHTHDLPQWRRLVNDVLHWQEPLLHNHTPEGGEYHRYPLVQYRALAGRGALLGIGDGAHALLRVLPLLQAELGRATLQMEEAAIQEGHYGYALYRWLALNPANYHEWKQTTSLAAHVQQLERILTGQLLGCLKTLEIEPLPKIVVEIQHLDELGHFEIPTDKGTVSHLAFGVKFGCNVLLPAQLGIGKFSAKGYGILQAVGVSPKPQPHVRAQQNQKSQKTG